MYRCLFLSIDLSFSIKKTKKMISVCMATYNGGKYIEQQISSILSQLSTDDEIIVSDDNSTDDTIAILHRINDKRIKIYYNSGSKPSLAYRYSNSHYKVTKNFENALLQSSGEYIFLSDQDDVWEPNKVSCFLSALKDNMLVMSNYSIIDSDNQLIINSYYHVNPIQKSLIRNLLKMPFHGCCMAFRRELLNETLPFPEKLIMHDNWIGLLACAKGHRVGFIDSPLIKYRRHQSNVSPSSVQNKNPLWFKLWYRIVLVFQLINRSL